jgi:hypothetical protein
MRFSSHHSVFMTVSSMTQHCTIIMTLQVRRTCALPMPAYRLDPALASPTAAVNLAPNAPDACTLVRGLRMPVRTDTCFLQAAYDRCTAHRHFAKVARISRDPGVAAHGAGAGPSSLGAKRTGCEASGPTLGLAIAHLGAPRLRRACAAPRLRKCVSRVSPECTPLVSARLPTSTPTRRAHEAGGNTTRPYWRIMCRQIVWRGVLR